MEEKLKTYFKNKGLGKVAEVKDLSGEGHNSHLNYKVVAGGKKYLARMVRPGDLVNHANLSDEYTILKLVEKYQVGPRALSIDLEYFETPILLEEFLEGSTYGDLVGAGEEEFQKAIGLIYKVSEINVTEKEFPFKFAYSTFETNFRAWEARLEEIGRHLGNESSFVKKFSATAVRAREVLKKKDLLLRESPKEFIYNDVHPGNMFYTKDGEAKFIDWQKVSLGNPAFMLALFARRFGEVFGMERESFYKKSLDAYKKLKNTASLEEIFYATMLERAVSDMIWSVWARVRKGEPVLGSPEKNQYLKEAEAFLLKN